MKPLSQSIRDLDFNVQFNAELRERLRSPWPDLDEEEKKAGKTPGQGYVEQAERQAEEDKR